MSKVKILVVEDEIIIADNICKTLKSLHYEVFEPALNYTEAIEIIEKQKPDIAILDIHLSGKKTGIDLGKKINESYNFPFIFLTANSDLLTFNKAKKTAPNAFLTKPFSRNDLFTSIEIAIHNFSKNILSEKKSVFIKQKSSFMKINFNEILFIKSAHIYIEIHCKENKKVITRTSLNEIIEKLNNEFIRIQRGYIVNTNYITKVNQDNIQISDITIPTGKKYRDDIVKKMGF